MVWQVSMTHRTTCNIGTLKFELLPAPQTQWEALDTMHISCKVASLLRNQALQVFATFSSDLNQVECIYVCSMLVVDICMSWPLWQCIQYVYRLHKCCIANMLPLRWCHLAVLINAGMFATWYHTWFTLLCEGVLKLLIACLCSARLCEIAS